MYTASLELNFNRLGVFCQEIPKHSGARPAREECLVFR